jgi:flavin reductase (DIM6/NTAB) family NADH-FMN oxidoreductase RutF
LGGAVTLWTAGDDGRRAGLTVTSVLVAGPDTVLGLLDPDSDLCERLESSGRAVVQLLGWEHRDLADAFAGAAPAPGGMFRTGSFQATAYGPRLEGVSAWAFVSLAAAHEVGWSRLVTCTVDEVGLSDDSGGLAHRRGRYLRLDQPL